MWLAVALGYHLLGRLAYVIWVGVALTRQYRHQAFTRNVGIETGFQRFRKVASRLMLNDAASFVALCVVTRASLPERVPAAWTWWIGGTLMIVGVATKVWAARTLGAKAYYWHNFFNPEAPATLVSPGPYRFLRNPMYTVGYLQAYGLALVLGSPVGLAAALFDQAAILVFHYVVENPHYRALLLSEAALAAAGHSSSR